MAESGESLPWTDEPIIHSTSEIQWEELDKNDYHNEYDHLDIYNACEDAGASVEKDFKPFTKVILHKERLDMGNIVVIDLGKKLIEVDRLPNKQHSVIVQWPRDIPLCMEDEFFIDLKKMGFTDIVSLTDKTFLQ
ncbi:hypothetical protein Ciccas_006634 [Cichlidogyrus casuarinus]|uniref:Uncharacterized protein n=1 Tax=Cichlidogyrus casuarinus TaxID=1844966 RepID=A0ABD2Q594_9PLAT